MRPTRLEGLLSMASSSSSPSNFSEKEGINREQAKSCSINETAGRRFEEISPISSTSAGSDLGSSSPTPFEGEDRQEQVKSLQD